MATILAQGFGCSGQSNLVGAKRGYAVQLLGVTQNFVLVERTLASAAKSFLFATTG